MAKEIRPPEWLLDQLYETGREWILARAQGRAHGPPSDWGRGDNPPKWEEPRQSQQAAAEEQELRARFERLVDEFIDRIESP
jgi:hypothetical protein